MRNLFFEAKQFTLTLFRLFYVFISGGEKCAVCGKTVFIKPVCSHCMKLHFSVENLMQIERCENCGKELIGEKGMCSQCRENTLLVSTARVIPLFSYRLWNKEIMFRWKMQGERSFSPLFASLLAQVLKRIGETVIVPVPPRKGKIRKNGWDQIDELCTFLTKRYGFKVLKILERNTREQQKKLSRSERLEHIKTAYSLCELKVFERALKPFSGRLPQSVCLIDDVCTTGSTIESCAAILKEVGIEKVSVLTLFTVD